jgi:hypothetical protein
MPGGYSPDGEDLRTPSRGSPPQHTIPPKTAQDRQRGGNRKAGSLLGGESQRAPGLTINQIVLSGRTRAHTQFGVSLYARWPLSRVFGVGQSEGRSPVTWAGWELRPMIEAGEPSTGPFRDRDIGCARPTGNSYGRTTPDPAHAQQGKVKAAPNAMGRKAKQRGQEQYRGRSLKAPSR